MKKMLCLFFLFICAFLTCTVYAEDGYATVLGSCIRIRKGPSTKYDIITEVNSPNKYRVLNPDIVKDERMNGDCDMGWYNIDYNGTSAYICSKFVDYTVIAPTNDCLSDLKNQGFPSDYADSLCKLKVMHPTWSFKPIITNLDWQTAVDKESACGKSYLETWNNDYIDTSCKSAYAATSDWKPASKTAIAYYMDPRNWLNEKTVFQFSTNKYEDNLSDSYTSLSRNIIKNTNFYSYHFGIGNDLAEITKQAGALSDVRISPMFISSRMIQELGSKNTLLNLYSGTYPGFEGLYNFFNIGVSDTCATTSGPTACGLAYAKEKGWNSPLNAIAGGARFISSSYVNKGQYTTYLQKFNVTPSSPSSLYTHQYMSNIAAPQSEAKSMYSSIVTAKLLESPFVFYIPVYNNMGTNITNTPSGAVTDSTNTNPTTSSVETIVTSVGYKYDSSTIQGIKIGTNAKDIKNSIESVAGSGNVQVLSSDGKVMNDGTIRTGSKIQINNASGSTTLTVIIKGDTSGDGVINALDLLQVQKNILRLSTLNDIYKAAADTSGDGQINALDLLQIQKNILGIYEITQ